ncbi:hypothetical protein FP76_gp109 [Bacillus phage Evoli]|uniref:Uncharacterized protein n=1 Tax=Bacillus phage Evoli TaxID=1486658 RepID=A0A024B0J4_9CAUD|nr:hypothetical protein FP76_gp109 [Bacillus phage Evoli]AHZ09985.1 hypothetical protein [Bacillus phage Evoli]
MKQCTKCRGRHSNYGGLCTRCKNNKSSSYGSSNTSYGSSYNSYGSPNNYDYAHDTNTCYNDNYDSPSYGNDSYCD